MGLIKETYHEEITSGLAEAVQNEQQNGDWEENNVGNDIAIALSAPFLTPNKAMIAQWAGDVTLAVELGYLDPFEAHMRLKAIMKACEAALEATEDAAMKEAKKYQKEGVFMGNTFTLSDGRANWKYANSPHIVALEKQLKAAKALAVTLAKGNGKPVADTETGELIYPAIDGGGKASISITFK